MVKKNLTDFKDLLIEKKVLTVLSVARENKAPHTTPVWFETSEESLKNNEISFNSNKSRIKGKIIQLGTPIIMTILDPENVFRYISMAGSVSQVVDGKEAFDHINQLSQKYLGKDYPFLQPNEERVKFVFKITKVY